MKTVFSVWKIKMDLREYTPTTDQINRLKRTMIDPIVTYQPLILSDNCCTGTADDWINKSGVYLMEKDNVRPEEWDRFAGANAKMIRMYNDWIDSICNLAGSLSDLTVVDTAANQGYFLYEFLKRGAKRAVAYDNDHPLLHKSYKLLNEITGYNVEFISEPYDMMTHKIPDAIEGDIVLSSAIMVHLSDPTYYLKFLGSITKKLLFLFTAIDDNPGYCITYTGEPRTFYKHFDFPICFDAGTSVSQPLIELGLRELGFKKVIELSHQKDWLPISWYKPYKAFIAIR